MLATILQVRIRIVRRSAEAGPAPRARASALPGRALDGTDPDHAGGKLDGWPRSGIIP